jgi:hypothetical protein
MAMMSDTREMLSALVDGEAIDADAVAAALETAANRALLVDFVRLRGSVQRDDEAVPDWRPHAAVAGALPPSRSSRAWLRIAAALALLSAGALGGTWAHALLTREQPPEPTRIVQLELVQPR